MGRYRLPQILVHRLVEEIRPHSGELGQVPLHIQFLTVLNFYASGSYQVCVFSHSQSTTSS